MTTTANIGVTKIDSAQAQKEVTANEAFDVFDAALSELAITLTDADYTLSLITVPKQWQYGVIKLSGTLTAARNVVAPTNKKLYVIVNNTTGGFAVTLKTSAGTGIAVSAGATSVLRCDGTNVAAVTSGTGSGTVTSVAASVPAEFSIAGSPVTTIGTLAITKANQAANLVWAGPASGAAAQPAFRALVAADIPAQPFDVHAFYPGIPTASAKVVRVPVARAVTFPDDFAGSYGVASATATASTAFDVQKNGSSVGTITFALGASTATFVTAAGALSLAAGDVLMIVAPGTPDVTLADIGFVLAGTR